MQEKCKYNNQSTINYFKKENCPSMLAKHELLVRGNSTASKLSIQSLRIIS